MRKILLFASLMLALSSCDSKSHHVKSGTAITIDGDTIEFYGGTMINVVQNSGGFGTLFTPDLFDFSVIDYTGFNPDDGSLENRVVLQMYR